MLTYFARHTSKLDIDGPTRRRLWDDRRIAVHFPHAREGKRDRDCQSLSPGDYKGPARRAMNALVNLARSGGYVCAQYHGEEASLVGVVEAGTPIELLEGQWGTLHGNAGRSAVLKTLRLTRVKEIRPSDSVAVLVGRPRQGTLMRWPSAGTAIENLVEGRTAEARLADLSDAQQETLCGEFLRLPEARTFGLPNLLHLFLPVGRTMKDIDIYGLADDGGRLFAQVTFKTLEQASGKLARLLPYRDTDRSHLILFCRTESPAEVEGVLVVPIEEVFARFIACPSGRQWLTQSS